ncbi:RNA polymerase sigma factor [Acetivibrio straminisolvens]|uniref:RNA polymerase n=1 Tax=Acetivibrio straminisolvens JCM 21531 TaxID=1294263 RepID=W4VBD3_9FIRM|nr:sigma factor [Acetivibrio straminisolvens]GAE90481.1 RNA polymerase [Acetivibrio straminisolvens JCM 21531]
MEQKSLCTGDDVENVIRSYSNMVYRLAFSQTTNKSDADDIYQEVFLRYIRKRPQFETEEHRKAWFIRVTVNCCKKVWVSAWIRKKAQWMNPLLLKPRKKSISTMNFKNCL